MSTGVRQMAACVMEPETISLAVTLVSLSLINALVIRFWECTGGSGVHTVDTNMPCSRRRRVLCIEVSSVWSGMLSCPILRIGDPLLVFFGEVEVDVAMVEVVGTVAMVVDGLKVG